MRKCKHTRTKKVDWFDTMGKVIVTAVAVMLVVAAAAMVFALISAILAT